MDPTFTIDLKSVAGIVVTTVALVHQIKGWLASTRGLSQIPVSLYVVLVSSGLTWLSADVLHWIDGDLSQLLAQAVLQALAASGFVEWARAGAKPLADSQRAYEVREGRSTLMVLLAAGLTVF